MLQLEIMSAIAGCSVRDVIEDLQQEDGWRSCQRLLGA